MSRKGVALALGSVSTWALRNVFHRAAENFPGKVALLADPHLIADLRSGITEGTVVVVGTNGKTTVTNLLADALEASGKSVACNRTGANLDSGIASALLHTPSAEWGVFESDELWLAKILPPLQPDFVVLLNLFRDQLDRAGEIEHVQQCIVEALASCPNTTLVYNADDPFCQAIADWSENAGISFGVAEDMGLPQNRIADSGLCQACDATLDYAWRQYGQLGSYRCPRCGFARKEPAYRATDTHIGMQGVSFTMNHGDGSRRIESPLTGAYMAYNLLATCTIADCCGLPPKSVEHAICGFSPENGRLQSYCIEGCTALLNLAKNPVGLNQNLRIVSSAPGPRAVAFFINDREADGRDVSWLWDVDFDELARLDGLSTFAGGIRKNDLQVRLKYAGIDALLVDGAHDFVNKAHNATPGASLFLIANYTALPEVKAALDEMALTSPAPDREHQGEDRPVPDKRPRESQQGIATQLATTGSSRPMLTIVHLYPELLNLYGDGGNVSILANRAQRRGIDARVIQAARGKRIDFRSADIVFIGGGPDREQRIASESLLEQAEALRCYTEDDGVLLAICGGFQIIGREWLLGNETVAGLGLADFTTKRAKGGSHNRIVGNIVLTSPLAKTPVVGYENHAGRTYLGSGCEPFGRVVGKIGKGNNDADGVDGVLYRNIVGTYLHGPVLAKNPEVADWLIERALARHAKAADPPAPELPPLDDAEERAANAFMRRRLNAGFN